VLTKLKRALGLTPDQLNIEQVIDGVLPVAPPELAYNWSSGNPLNANGVLSGANVAGTTITSSPHVLIPDDGFYIIDFEAQGMVAVTAGPVRRAEFNIFLDTTQSSILWGLVFNVNSGVGGTWSPRYTVQERMWFLKGMVILARLTDASLINDQYHVNIRARKLFVN
jgi:hypothetical protein